MQCVETVQTGTDLCNDGRLFSAFLLEQVLKAAVKVQFNKPMASAFRNGFGG